MIRPGTAMQSMRHSYESGGNLRCTSATKTNFEVGAVKRRYRKVRWFRGDDTLLRRKLWL
jgi:hypothetical protein